MPMNSFASVRDKTAKDCIQPGFFKRYTHWHLFIFKFVRKILGINNIIFFIIKLFRFVYLKIEKALQAWRFIFYATLDTSCVAFLYSHWYTLEQIKGRQFFSSSVLDFFADLLSQWGHKRLRVNRKIIQNFDLNPDRI